jgi:hypothetical protein
MKKKIFIIFLPLVLFSNSCMNKKDNENIVNILDGYLYASQLNMASFIGGYSGVYSCMFTQQISGVSGAMFNIERYNIDSEDTNEMWNYYFSNILKNLKLLIINAEKNNFKKYAGMGKVLMAQSFGVGTDIWGDLPVSNFINEDVDSYPEFNSQEEVYQKIFDLLDNAISDFNESMNQYYEISNDVYFHGNLSQWIKFANFLKLKYSLRVSTEIGWNNIFDLTQLSLFVSSSDSLVIDYKLLNYPSSPFYFFSNSYPNQLKAGSNLINLLIDKSDPRLIVYFGLNADGYYSGSAPGSENISASPIASKYNSPYAPYTLASYTEQMFIEAEVFFMNGLSADAINSYNEGLKSSLIKNKVYNESWYNANKLTNEITLEQIMTAKYIALFLNPEVWTDWRRTGFPSLTVAENNFTEGNIPRRLPYPSEEYRLNPNNVPPAVPIYQPLWWDSLNQ